MATVKVTFTLDEPTVARLSDAASRLGIAKSEVVREAVQEFHARIGRLSDGERAKLLRAFDELVPKIAPRSEAAVERELARLRQARKLGGRRAAVRKSA
jgi:hypothetical protein